MSDFFNKMKDNINKGVVTISTGSKTMVERTKINTMIKNIEKDKKYVIEILGNKVYKFFLENNQVDIPITEINNICQEITSLNIKIEDLKKKLREVDNELTQIIETNITNIKCAYECGFINEANSKFCAKCGNKLI